MSAPHILLIEDLAAAGSDPRDARERATVLRAAGAQVQLLTIDGRDLDELLRAVRASKHDRVLVASPSPHGGRIARRLPRGHPAWWLPCGFAQPSAWRALTGLPPLPGLDQPASALAGCALPSAPGRRPLPLWDGEFVLAPTALSGPSAEMLLGAFAVLARERTDLDLVVLADPQPGFERIARRLEIGIRVHFVGSAPRDAELAWWSQARAAAFAGHGPIAGELVLRGLQAGCPLVAVRGGAAGVLGAWLAERQLAPPPAGQRAALVAELDEALERGAAVEQRIARGRELAVAHDHASLATRLAPIANGGRPSKPDAGGRARAA